MAKGMYIGIDNIARKIKEQYIGVNNVARKVTKGYVGVNNVARVCLGCSHENVFNYIDPESAFDWFDTTRGNHIAQCEDCGEFLTEAHTFEPYDYVEGLEGEWEVCHKCGFVTPVS